MTQEEAVRRPIEGWMIVEIFGHQKYVGYVSHETLGQSVMFRVDVPELPEREYVLRRGSYDSESRYIQPGTKVKAGAVQGYSKLFGVGAVYSLTPVTQEAAMKALAEIQPQPLMVVGVNGQKAIAAGSEEDESDSNFIQGDEDDDYEEDDEDGDDEEDD